MQSYGNFTLQLLRTKIWKKGKILESFQLTEKCILTPDSCSRRKISQLWDIGGLCISKNEENTILWILWFFLLFLKSSTSLLYLAVHCFYYEHGEWNSSQIRLSCCADAIKQGKTTINCVKTSCLIQKTPKALIFGEVEFWQKKWNFKNFEKIVSDAIKLLPAESRCDLMCPFLLYLKNCGF